MAGSGFDYTLPKLAERMRSEAGSSHDRHQKLVDEAWDQNTALERARRKPRQERAGTAQRQYDREIFGSFKKNADLGTCPVHFLVLNLEGKCGECD